MNNMNNNKMNNIRDRILYLMQKYEEPAQKQNKQTFIDDYDCYYAIS